MKRFFDQIMLHRKMAQLEKKWTDSQREVDYYKRVAQEAGQKRLTEVYQMNQLIEERKAAEKEREKVIKDLKTALDEVKTLQGFIPICASCKKIRDDKGYWNQIEQYIQKHSCATFSHGICPECLEKKYGKEVWYKKLKK
jgi:DNA repair exonuclease SbcCD ATPase subunit